MITYNVCFDSFSYRQANFRENCNSPFNLDLLNIIKYFCKKIAPLFCEGNSSNGSKTKSSLLALCGLRIFQILQPTRPGSSHSESGS